MSDFEDLIDTTKGTVHHVSRWNGRHSTGAPKRGAPGSDDAKRRLEPQRQAAYEDQVATTTQEPGEFILTFGKHKGETLRSIPRGYVEWLADAGFKAGSPAAHAAVVARLYLGEGDAECWLDRELAAIVG